MELERVNKILHNEEYKKYLKKIAIYEEKRKFCKHDMNHFLDTARITYILNLEKKLGINKEIIYALGLLHDIGRWKEYEENIPHDIASADLSKRILIESGFNECEREEIINAILSHRKDNKENYKKKDDLCSIFYKADKICRKCFQCKSKEECNWTDEKKNLHIKY